MNEKQPPGAAGGRSQARRGFWCQIRLPRSRSEIKLPQARARAIGWGEAVPWWPPGTAATQPSRPALSGARWTRAPMCTWIPVGLALQDGGI